MDELESKRVDSDTPTKAAAAQVVHIEGTTQLFDDSGALRKIPVPTDDPDDPLTWPLWTRTLVFVVICVYGITGFGVVQSTPMFFNDIIGDYKAETRGAFDANRIGDLASYPSLCMGIGNFLFVPLSLAFGRRPVAIFCASLMLASCAWATNVKGFNAHLATRCLQGLAAGIADCLLPLIVLDITFLHNRGRWMTLYWAVTAIGASLLLVAVPFIVHSRNDNWHVNYQFWLGFACLTLVLVLTCLPETSFYRPPAFLNGQMVISDSYGQVRFENASEDNGSPMQGETANSAKKHGTFARRLLPVCYEHPDSRLKNFLGAYRDMIICLTNPAIIWTLVLNSFLFAGLVIFSITYERTLQGPPWLFEAKLVGTAQLGAAIGSACAYLFTGTMIERTVEFLVRRNQGIREPEHLLPSFAFPAALGTIGLCVYGVVGGNPFKYSWVGIHASLGVYYCAFVAISALSNMWVAELTPKRAGPAIVLICGGRNAASFGLSYSFTPWLNSVGFQNVHVSIGCIFLGISLVAIPLFFLNKPLRKMWNAFVDRY